MNKNKINKIKKIRDNLLKGMGTNRKIFAKISKEN